MSIPPAVKKYLVIWGVAAAALLGAFASGRYTVPTKVVEKEKIVYQQVLVEHVDEKLLEALTLQVKSALSQLSQLKKSIHREKTSTTFPDGRIEARQVEDINIDRTVQTTEIKEVLKEVVVVQEKIVDRLVTVEKIVEKEKTISAEKPQWKLTPMAGVNVLDITVAQGLTTGPFVFGGAVERRIIGPVFAGAWGLSSGQAGVAVTVEF